MSYKILENNLEQKGKKGKKKTNEKIRVFSNAGAKKAIKQSFLAIAISKISDWVYSNMDRSNTAQPAST